MVTIGDVAKQAGVSKSTVSNVFSKKRPISEDVTKRVIRVAKELNYVPNHMARSLAIKKTMIIGLKMPTVKDYELSSFETKVINGVVKKSSENGYRVLLDRIYEGDDQTNFSRDPVDGVILLNPREDDARIVQYRDSSMPFVLIGRPDRTDMDIKCVDNNNIEMAKEVGEYLIGNGHREILFLNASYHMTVAEDRKAGLMQAYDNYNMPFDEGNVVYYGQSTFSNASEYGYVSFLEKIKEKKYTAVIADSDRVALGVMRAAREMEVDIPGDVSLIALSNNETLALETTPNLTSVELFPEKLGEEAAEVLINMLNKQLVPRIRTIPAKLVIRDSCQDMKHQEA
ncbi:LacI family DNA-binding transcriptional regulator [Metabacillus hrfriensis]|uniref:LacI family DNA-binding transcriptional regulator n=1 Tax=Metabacillus hrfriensis TaxID=3048891 RepID=A0ACD4RAW5_9BACI|nr:LacI family DNA-binding transcriptional regulator [Metabacillus sp. CT-WN-B3]WHZ57586.1 LacI family DNA-binding transcriptional regulator [Metabacillus sp. CT-WN-B3]